MKKFRLFILTILLLPVLFLFSACGSGAYVVSIEKGKEFENYTVYTITYSDGKISTFTVENGVNGEDGKDLSIQEIFEAYSAQAGDDGLTFDEFLQKYLTIKVDDVSYQSAVNKALMSTVDIYAYNDNPTGIVCGAGVIYKMEDEFSYILTNYHITYTSERDNNVSDHFYLYQYGQDAKFAQSGNNVVAYGNCVSAEFVGGSGNYDLAVLKCKTADLKRNNPSACEVTIAESYSVSEDAIAIGNPDGAGMSVSKGVVSVDSESLTLINADQREYTYRVMRIDTGVNGGNSGGGLFNNKGELIGIVNAKKLETNSGNVADNIAYALPIDNAKRVADNIMYHSTSTFHGVRKLVFGIEIEEQNTKCNYDGTNISVSADCVVRKVNSSSLAEQMGLRVGDTIKTVTIKSANTEKTYEINRVFNLTDLTLEVRQGDTVKMSVVRAGSETELTSRFVTMEDMVEV